MIKRSWVRLLVRAEGAACIIITIIIIIIIRFI